MAIEEENKGRVLQPVAGPLKDIARRLSEKLRVLDVDFEAWERDVSTPWFKAVLTGDALPGWTALGFLLEKINIPFEKREFLEPEYTEILSAQDALTLRVRLKATYETTVTWGELDEGSGEASGVDWPTLEDAKVAIAAFGKPTDFLEWASGEDLDGVDVLSFDVVAVPETEYLTETTLAQQGHERVEPLCDVVERLRDALLLIPAPCDCGETIQQYTDHAADCPAGIKERALKKTAPPPGQAE